MSLTDRLDDAHDGGRTVTVGSTTVTLPRVLAAEAVFRLAEADAFVEVDGELSINYRNVRGIVRSLAGEDAYEALLADEELTAPELIAFVHELVSHYAGGGGPGEA